MKAIPVNLVCYTSAGYPCYHNSYKSKNDAIKTAKELIDEGCAFSYRLLKVK